MKTSPRASGLSAIPPWSQRSLQALAYWIGWSHERYPQWPLLEGAMVAELQRGITASLGPDQVVHSELDIQALPTGRAVGHGMKAGRIDLAILRVPRPGIGQGLRSDWTHHAEALIEVKRTSPWAGIKKDLERLASLHKALPGGARCFLIVGCQAGSAPSRLVSDFKATPGWQSLSNGRFRVRRVWRASPGVTRSKAAHMVVLVEVFSEPRD